MAKGKKQKKPASGYTAPAKKAEPIKPRPGKAKKKR